MGNKKSDQSPKRTFFVLQPLENIILQPNEANLVKEHENETIPVTKEVPSLISIQDFIRNELKVTSSTSTFKNAGPSSSAASYPEILKIQESVPNFPENRKRQRKANPCNWKCNIQMTNRMHGKDYLGREINSNKNSLVVQKQARRQGGKCKVHLNKGSIFQCYKIPEAEFHQLFDQFWNDMNWGQKKIFIRALVEKSSKSGNVRTGVRYYLNSKSTRVRVCRPFFLSTFGIKRKTVEGWCHGYLNPPRMPIRSKNIAISNAEEFLDSLPKEEAHYCRKDSSKLYLEAIFNNLADLYRLYKSHCDENNKQNISHTAFRSLFDRKNLALFRPKKDLCNTCELFKVGNITTEDYKIHQMKKERARAEKQFDKAMSIQGNCHCITVDMQSIKQSPILNANCIYFKSKLNVYNYTVYNVANADVMCYFWNESEGGMLASSFASCLIDFLENLPGEIPIIIYSDGCGYQNRNVCLSNALLNFAMKSGKTVYQKYLEKGHTQMECDSVHSVLERKSKNQNIRLPSDYLEICKTARASKGSILPYGTTEASYDFFGNYSIPSMQRYSTIRPGFKRGDPEVKDIRALQYHPSGSISYKINFDDDWKDLPKRPKVLPIVITLPQLYISPLKLKESKWKDLQDLKEFLKKDCRQFYESLPH